MLQSLMSRSVTIFTPKSAMRRLTASPFSTAAASNSQPSPAVSSALQTIESASKAFPEWSSKGPNERRRVLLKAADILESRTDDLTNIMAKETKSSPPWAGFNSHLAADILREAGALTTQVTGQVIPSDVPGSLSMALRVPCGVVLGLAPWNAPVILAARAVAVPLAVGNTAVLKASEKCVETHRIVYESLRDAGLPEGALGFIGNTDPLQAKAISETAIAHPAVRRVNFTGSTRVGREIAVTAARHLKPALLELGGKAPLVVLSDANVDAAVDAAIFGCFANSGQICMSTERLIVDSAVADEFSAKLVARIKALPPPIVGPLITEDSARHCADLLFDAVKHGAKLVAGGPPNPLTAHLPPTLLDHITPTMRIWREESFGPVKGILRVTGDEEAIAMANDTEYGLSAAVFSRTRGLDAAQKIRSGICHVNGPTVHDEAQMPFGGLGSSGYGRFGGGFGVNEFTETRWVTVQSASVPRHYPF